MHEDDEGISRAHRAYESGRLIVALRAGSFALAIVGFALPVQLARQHPRFGSFLNRRLSTKA